MKLSVIVILIYLSVAVLDQQSIACSGIFIANNHVKLFGLNEDFHDYNTIYRTMPGTVNTYGIIGFGHSNSIQAIINEKGLIYDGYGAPEKQVTRNSSLPQNNGTFIFEAMTKCATIEEVVLLYDKQFHPWLSNGQIFFADKNGNSVIIEGDELIYKVNDYQVCTNFYQSDPTSGIDQGFWPCWRFNHMTEKIENTNEYSLGFVRDILNDVHAENQTSPGGMISSVYSLIIDLNSEKITVYNLYDFENPVTLDIKSELSSPAQSKTLKELFPITSLENEQSFPTGFNLLQNYPNPFNPSTTIEFTLPTTDGIVGTSLRIYDLLGREVETVVREQLHPGMHEIEFDASHLTSGVYYYILIAGKHRMSKKMTLLK